MKLISFIIFYVLFSHVAQGQGEASNWYFGNFGGVKFTPNGVIPLDGSAMSVNEGSATISTPGGRLLFYTKGNIVYNRIHAKMKNGTGLFGDPECTQNAVIIPKPHNDSIFYIFTIDQGTSNRGLNYSVVNIHGDSGLGEVIDKNIHLADSVYEKITAVQNCNRKNVWVAVRQFNSDIYKAFEVTPSGVFGPITSNTGVVVSGVSSNTIGAMKFSNDGTKLAAAHGYSNDFIELLDFDNTTGVFSNAKVFRANTTPPSSASTGTYGIEFSPDDHLLYCSSYLPDLGNSYLHQFDVTQNSVITISNSKKLIAMLPEEIMASLQIGIDKKIYISTWGDYYLSVINDPNVPDVGCNFVRNVIRVGSTSGHNCQGGLPSFIQSYFNTAFNAYDFYRDGNCLDRTVAFTLTKTVGIDSVKWNFGDNSQSVVQQPTHFYSAPGYYTISLIVYKQDCSGVNDSITHTIWIAGDAEFLGRDTSLCNKSPIMLGYTVTDADYLWNTGSIRDFITTDSSGTYTLQIMQSGCTISDSKSLSITPKPIVTLGSDTAICKGQGITFSAGNPGSTYLWSTGDSSQSIRVTDAGNYSVTVSNNGCSASAGVIVKTGSCELLLPTAFSPNGDGLNDEFGLLNKLGIKNLNLRVYDRWGKVLFKTTDIDKRWSGKYNGNYLPLGVYIWTITYTNAANQVVSNKGTVMLLR